MQVAYKKVTSNEAKASEDNVFHQVLIQTNLTKNNTIIHKADSPHTPEPRAEQTNTTIPGEIQEAATTQSKGTPSTSNSSHSLGKADPPSASQIQTQIDLIHPRCR